MLRRREAVGLQPAQDLDPGTGGLGREAPHREATRPPVAAPDAVQSVDPGRMLVDTAVGASRACYDASRSKRALCRLVDRTHRPEIAVFPVRVAAVETEADRRVRQPPFDFPVYVVE